MTFTKLLFALSAMSLATPALAQDYTTADKARVVERNANGKAVKVEVAGVIYDVCMSDAQDHCINPRAAGLGWGDIPLSYWPGKTWGDS